ncbi:GTA-gp10 family protein [Sphingomonas sp.]|uniref:GTA-gp10 family protein n=1 Tax=Sphingomonas sp. TaxID=28214 RepID=UPI003BA88CEE
MSDHPANAARGEHELKLGKTCYVLRPSYAAISAAEAKTGHSLMALLRLADASDLSLAHLGVVVAELIRAGAGKGDDLTAGVNAERIAELIFEEGMPHVMARVTICLLDAASGGRTATGEMKPVAEMAIS